MTQQKKHISPSYYQESRERLQTIDRLLEQQVPIIKRMRSFLRKWVEEKQELEMRQ